MKIARYLLVVTFFLINTFSCKNEKDFSISKTEMIEIAKTNGNKFSFGIRSKDANFIADIYSDSAQYVQPGGKIFVGKDSIRKDWEGFIKLKENPIDLVLNLCDVRGNREIIYETGHGYTLLKDSTKWQFNYVNVWRLQNDGSYKLEIDTYN